MDAQVVFRFLVELAALKDETRPEPNTPAYGHVTFSCGMTAESGRVAMDITGKTPHGKHRSGGPRITRPSPLSGNHHLRAKGSDPPGWTDRIQLVAVVSALVLDVTVLGTMVARIGKLGFTPNRTAALGLNLLLLVSLAGTAWLSNRFLIGGGTYDALERWQTTYLPVFALWAAVVVVVLPPLFDFA